MSVREVLKLVVVRLAEGTEEAIFLLLDGVSMPKSVAQRAANSHTTFFIPRKYSKYLLYAFNPASTQGILRLCMRSVHVKQRFYQK